MGFKNVFQGLTRLFSDGSPSVALNQQTAPQPNTYNLNGNDILFKTNSKDEYEAKLLQGRQQNLLAKQWRRATNELNNKSLASLNEVQLMYRDTELMDAFPEIGTAMDIFAEESCYIGKTGFMVNINSKSERVKSVLEDLLVNRLQINVTLPMVSRAMCKYGNCFMLLDMNAKSGVVNWKQLPVMEMQRFENGMDNPYSSAYSNLNNIDLSTDVSPKFVWVGQNEFIPYRSWQIGHFRLLYDSQFLPYGCSILNKARRHFRILSMMEDSMLLYRLERSMERRVFKINVGAINPDDVPAYVQEVMNEFKRTPIVDPQTGQLDLRKNILPVHKDTPIPLLDGRTIPIKELAKEYEEGKENFVYSIQDNTLKIVPGKVVWCGKNYTAESLVKITLDDNSHMIMAPEHEIIMRDGSRKRADEVKPGESVMPLYREVDLNAKKAWDRYEKVYNPNTGKYQFTHRLVAEDVEKGEERYNTVHHKDFNKYNNSPTNLLWMDFQEHKKMHGDLARAMWKDQVKKKMISEKLSKSCKGRVVSEEAKAKRSQTLRRKYANGEMEKAREASRRNINAVKQRESWRQKMREYGLQRGYREEFKLYNNSELHKQHDAIRSQVKKECWQDPEKAKVYRRHMRVFFDEYMWEEIEKGVIAGKIYSQYTMRDYINENLIEHLLEINSSQKLHNLGRITKSSLRARIKENGFESCDEYLDYLEKKHNLRSHYEILLEEKSERGKKYNIAKNFGKRWENTNRKDEIIGKIVSKTRLHFDDFVWDGLRKDILNGEITMACELCKVINTKYFKHILSINNPNFKKERLSESGITRIIRRQYGNITPTEYIQMMKKNHKITSVEMVGGDDVYCMTVVGVHGEEDRHNFALTTWRSDGSYNDSGVFVSNCQQDDYFVPVRDSSEPSPIETLQGAQNLTAMDDIKYIQNKIVTALRIPKQFLNFEETTGDGKNLSLLDVRFMRTVNRIQQALLMELNKICIIHLYMLGFEDDLTNFSLTMNNPSTQAEMMELDNLAKKITTAKDAVSDLGNGMALMSLTRAWREILGWSDKEIADNLEQMRLEAALAIEMQKTSQIIKRTGLFDPVDNVYGEAGADYSEESMEGEGSEGGPGGGGFGGGGLGGGLGADMDFGDEEGLEGGAEGEMPMEDAAAEEGEAAQEDEIPPMGEAYLNNLLKKTLNEQKMLKERLLKENMDKQEKYLRKLTEHRNERRNENEPKPVPIFQKSFLINQELNEMVNHMKEISADKVDNPFEG